MAINFDVLSTAVLTPTTYVAPTTNETISSPGPGRYVHLKVGATTTTFTLVRPGNNLAGDAVADYTSGNLVNTERLIPITLEYRDPSTGTANLQISQVTGVTANGFQFNV